MFDLLDTIPPPMFATGILGLIALSGYSINALRVLESQRRQILYGERP